MYDNVLYEKPFLKQVIARIDFVAPLAGLEKGVPAKLANTLSEHFPIVEPAEAMTHEIEINTKDQAVSQRKNPSKLWNFFGKEREKQLALGQQFVYVNYTKYENFDDLKENFAPVVEAIRIAFPDAKAGRFGLRYINNIEGYALPVKEGWEKYISAQLVSAISFFDSDRLTRVINVAETKCGDLNLRFQFGLANPDYPAVLKRSSFILDLDASIQEAHLLAISLQHLDRAHSCIQELFEKSITDDLRERMNAKSAVRE